MKCCTDSRVPLISPKPQYTPSNNTPHLLLLSSQQSPTADALSVPHQPMLAPNAGKRRSIAIDGRNIGTRVDAAKSHVTKMPASGQFLTQPASNKRRSHNDVRGLFGDRQLMPPPSSQRPKPLGRLERDFIEVDEIGFGEFGSAIKVRFKHALDGQVFAVKKSKVFEGSRHR